MIEGMPKPGETAHDKMQGLSSLGPRPEEVVEEKRPGFSVHACT